MDMPRRPFDKEGRSSAWFSNPDAVDGYRLGGLPWPIETTRHAYLTLLGGFSDDLAMDALGLHQQALEENTALEAGDKVTVSTFHHGEPVPFLARPSFEVVPLDFQTPDAFVQSSQGQAVLPRSAIEENLPGLSKLDHGVEVVINGVIAARTRRSGA